MVWAGVAEFIGTFTLVFLGAGSGAVAGSQPGGLVAVALTHALALVIIIYTWANASGAHVNPAVTLGTLLTGKIPVARAAVYWVAQCAGGLAAAFLLQYLLAGLPETVAKGLGETTGALTKDALPKALIIEFILTFFLVSAVFASGVAGLNGNVFGLAIGLVLGCDILMGGPLTGASMNPARTLGPAVAAGDLSYVPGYVVAQLAAGAVAGILYNSMFIQGPTKVS